MALSPKYFVMLLLLVQCNWVVTSCSHPSLRLSADKRVRTADSGSAGNNKNRFSKHERQSEVAEIEKIKFDIDQRVRQNKCKRVDKVLFGTDNGGELVAFSQGQKMLKLEVSLGMSNKAITKLYYFDNNSLRLIISAEQRYGWDSRRETFDLDPSKYHSIHPPSKYYFRKGAMIYGIERGRVMAMSASGDTTRKQGIALLSEAREFIKYSRSRQKEITMEE